MGWRQAHEETHCKTGVTLLFNQTGRAGDFAVSVWPPRILARRGISKILEITVVVSKSHRMVGFCYYFDLLKEPCQPTCAVKIPKITPQQGEVSRKHICGAVQERRGRIFVLEDPSRDPSPSGWTSQRIAEGHKADPQNRNPDRTTNPELMVPDICVA